MIARFYGGPLHAVVQEVPDHMTVVQHAEVPPMSLHEPGNFPKEPMKIVVYKAEYSLETPTYLKNEDGEVIFRCSNV